MLRRPITSGSRQAPDPYDQFLESRFMYRKHTARDASCLFRVIAEQMYDTQMLHYEVRLECVRFMTRKRRIFEQHVRGDFDCYMLDMAKPRTYGTMLELRAFCCMYRRNVVLFEPFNLGTTVTYNDGFRHSFRVFYTNEYHFDSVYALKYVENAAICQSISFKLLYKMLFKLPDVDYAAETMLHPQTFGWGNYTVELDVRGYIERIVSSDGRFFDMDMPENTKCILENYKLCNFHSNHNQSSQSSKHPAVARSYTAAPASKSPSSALEQQQNSFMGYSDSTEIVYMCPNRLNSCVRQLLDDGITPFPYKVAKSLDNYMYRNIEFDSWNDMRKEAKRYNVYVNDYNFKVGAKCRVELLSDGEKQMYTCHIQKIGLDKSYCVVYVEHFGHKFLVPYETLHPLPPDEFRPWAMPFRYQRQIHHMHLARLVQKPKVSKWKKGKFYDASNYFEPSKSDLVQYLQIDNYYGSPPLFSEHTGPHQEQQQLQEQQQQPQEQQQQPQQQQAEIIDQDEQRKQRFQLRDKPMRHHQQPQKPQHQQAPPAGAGGAVAGRMPQPPAEPPAQFDNYMPMAGRPNGQFLSMPDDFQSGVFPGPPVSAEGIYMQLGGYVPPPPVSLQPPPVALQTPPVSMQLPPPVPPIAVPQPPLTAQPYMFSPRPQPPPALMLPSTGARSSCSNSSTTSTNAPSTRPNARRYNEDKSPHRSLHSNGDDLPADLGTLRYFYNMGVDMHMRMYPMSPPDDQMRMFGNNNYNQNQHNTDQQINSTPPPTPEAATGSAASEKLRARAKRATFFQKARTNPRPEPLPGFGKDQHLAHAMQLPTPTPSPNTQGNQFNFYTTPQAPQPCQQASQPPLLPPPMYYPNHKGGQNPYAWGMPPPRGAANMVGMPYEMMNNYNMEPNRGVNAKHHGYGPRH